MDITVQHSFERKLCAETVFTQSILPSDRLKSLQTIHIDASLLVSGIPMIDSLSAFDVTTFSDEAGRAYANGNFLNWLADRGYLFGHPNFDKICSVLVELHNQGEVDLLAPILSNETLHADQNDFWSIQTLYCKLIPDLNVGADLLSDAVRRLVENGGSDMMANEPNSAFREWLKRRPAETVKLLRKYRTAPASEIGLLAFVLEAGATLDLVEYHAQAVELLSDERPEARLSAVTALGRIDATANAECQAKGLIALCEHISSGIDDAEKACVAMAIFEVFANQPDVEAQRVLGVFRQLINQPSASLHFNLARSLGRYHKRFDIELQLVIIEALEQADPAMRGVVEQIDFAFSQCLHEDNKEAVAKCLQRLSDHQESPLELSELKGFKHRLPVSHPKIFNWLIIYWLRYGSHNSRSNLPSLFRPFLEQGRTLNFKLEDFAFSDDELQFICRKTLGYFLIDAAAAASILISCIRATKTKPAAETIAGLLFDPLMINFSGQARDVMEREAKVKAPRQKQIKDAIAAHEEYLDGLRSVPELREFWPSPSQRQAQAERQRKMFAESFRVAQAASVFSQLVTKQTLLSGAGSITYHRDSSGALHRSVSMLSSHGTSIEFPRLDAFDPVNFHNRIVHYRVEIFEP